MSYDKIVNSLVNVQNAKSIISKANFNKLFEILPAVDDGNCLFSSVEQLTVEYNLHELRQMVCDYYKTFDKYAEYPDESIKAKLQIQMMSDNEPEEDDEDTRLHEEIICTEFKWAGVMDVIALADILNINIVLLIMGKSGYTFQPFLNKKKYPTICVKFNGRDHFEPLLPKFDSGSPRSSSRSKTKSNSKSKSKSKSSKSISSETKRLISQLENSQNNALEAAKDISSETKKLISQIENSQNNAIDTAKDISSETRRLISQMEELGFNDSKKKSRTTKKNTPPKRATRASTRRKRS